MAVEYTETLVGEDDTGGNVLEALAQGHPYVFIVCRIVSDGQLDFSVNVGGGVADAETTKNILRKAIGALP